MLEWDFERQKSHYQLQFSQFQSISISEKIIGWIHYQLTTAVTKALVRINPTGRFEEHIFEHRKKAVLNENFVSFRSGAQ